MIKMVNRLRGKKEEEAQEEPEVKMTAEEKLLTEIRDLLKKEQGIEN